MSSTQLQRTENLCWWSFAWAKWFDYFLKDSCFFRSREHICGPVFLLKHTEIKDKKKDFFRFAERKICTSDSIKAPLRTPKGYHTGLKIYKTKSLKIHLVWFQASVEKTCVQYSLIGEHVLSKDTLYSSLSGQWRTLCSIAVLHSCEQCGAFIR